MKCEHITKCNVCNKEVCSYCVEDCSGCQLEWCKDCYLAHQECCFECLTMVCPDEVVVLAAVGQDPDDLIIPQVCPKCDMWNVQ